MRALLIASLILVVASGASAQTALIGQHNVARPGGVYTQLTSDDAATCAQLCAEDAICMAWTYMSADRACELKAVAPAPIAQTGAISGLSRRAPAFALRLASAPSAEAPSAPPYASEPTSVRADDPTALALLGGPDAAPPLGEPRDIRGR